MGMVVVTSSGGGTGHHLLLQLGVKWSRRQQAAAGCDEQVVGVVCRVVVMGLHRVCFITGCSIAQLRAAVV